jgi:hypothetical protein
MAVSLPLPLLLLLPLLLHGFGNGLCAADSTSFGGNTSAMMAQSSTDPQWQGMDDVLAQHRDEVLRLQVRIGGLVSQVHSLTHELSVANNVIRDLEKQIVALRGGWTSPTAGTWHCPHSRQATLARLPFVTRCVVLFAAPSAAVTPSLAPAPAPEQVVYNKPGSGGTQASSSSSSPSASPVRSLDPASVDPSLTDPGLQGISKELLKDLLLSSAYRANGLGNIKQLVEARRGRAMAR